MRLPFSRPTPNQPHPAQINPQEITASPRFAHFVATHQDNPHFAGRTVDQIIAEVRAQYTPRPRRRCLTFG